MPIAQLMGLRCTAYAYDLAGGGQPTLPAMLSIVSDNARSETREK